MTRIGLQRGRRWFPGLSLLAGLSVALGVASLPAPATAAISTALIQEILDGDEVFIETEKAEVDAIANFRQTISTQAARATLLFDNGAAGRLAPNSVVTVGQCIELEQGSLLAVGPANGCASGFEVGVEGTVYVLEVDGTGATQVKVLEGTVVVKTEQAPDPATAPNAADGERVGIVVEQGKKLAIEADGQPGVVEDLSEAEVAAILYGVLFNGFTLPIPGLGNLRAVLERLYPNLTIPSYPGFGVPGIPSLPGPRLPF